MQGQFAYFCQLGKGIYELETQIMYCSNCVIPSVAHRYVTDMKAVGDRSPAAYFWLLMFQQILHPAAKDSGNAVEGCGTCPVDVFVALFIHLDGSE